MHACGECGPYAFAGALSYPFFDPVLTDRAFLASPKVMLAAFSVGGAIAGTFILLFSFLGIYGMRAACVQHCLYGIIAVAIAATRRGATLDAQHSVACCVLLPLQLAWRVRRRAFQPT